MSSSKRMLRGFAAGLGLSLAVACLAGCSLTPAYSENASIRQLALTYPEPASRLQQIVYQELRRDFGGDAGPDASLATVSISQSVVDLTKSAVGNPREPYQVTLTGTLTITQRTNEEQAPTILFQATRHASASYTTDGQSLAERFAYTDAGENAARELAESLRLAILAGSSGATDGL